MLEGVDVGGAAVIGRHLAPVFWGIKALGTEEIRDHFRGQTTPVKLAEEHPAGCLEASWRGRAPSPRTSSVQGKVCFGEQGGSSLGMGQ